jgi:hypothetical protein
MPRRQRWTIFLLSVCFLLGIILAVRAIYAYNHVMCDDQIMNSGDRCIHYDIYGNKTGSDTIDQERPYWPIIGEGLGAFLFSVGGFVCTFKVLASRLGSKKPPIIVGPGPTEASQGNTSSNGGSKERSTAPNPDRSRMRH